MQLLAEGFMAGSVSAKTYLDSEKGKIIELRTENEFCYGIFY